jgi:asparagine synthetase B (glutamine-hydrolysing)
LGDEAGPYQLTGLELASGFVLGHDRSAPTLSSASGSKTPREALEDVLESCLRHPPCVVQFSGGRDSSAVLALAASVARRSSLPLPIPATMIFPGMGETDEGRWQEMVIDHLELPDWERLSLTDEMDFVGAVAGPLLLRYGPTYPCNGHFIDPILKLAQGGTVLTGVGGDELFDVNPISRLALVLARKTPIRRSDLKTLALVCASKGMRAAWYRREDPGLPWLRPEARRTARNLTASDLASSRLWWADDLRTWWISRPRLALLRTLRSFGQARDVVVRHPFEEEAFLSTLAAHYKRAAWVGRAAAMDDLFGDVLPKEVTQRRTKAVFTEAFFGPTSREFAQHWSGGGVDEALIDPEALRRAWVSPNPDARSASALQGAWAAENQAGCTLQP